MATISKVFLEMLLHKVNSYYTLAISYCTFCVGKHTILGPKRLNQNLLPSVETLRHKPASIDPLEIYNITLHHIFHSKQNRQKHEKTPRRAAHTRTSNSVYKRLQKYSDAVCKKWSVIYLFYLFSSSTSSGIDVQAKNITGRMANTGLTNHLCAAT